MVTHKETDDWHIIYTGPTGVSASADKGVASINLDLCGGIYRSMQTVQKIRSLLPENSATIILVTYWHGRDNMTDRDRASFIRGTQGRTLGRFNYTSAALDTSMPMETVVLKGKLPDNCSKLP